LLDKISDRTLMASAAALLTTGLAAMAVLTALFAKSAGYWPMLLAGWFVLGIAYSMSVTPSGRLLRRSANAEDRPAVFAAQFALSHGCWLICYPLAGQIGAGVSQVAAFAVLATVAGIGTFASLWLWPSHDPALVAHSHDDLPPDHAHMREDHDHGKTKSHAFVIDDIHPDWPRVA
jgi:MFS family permease